MVEAAKEAGVRFDASKFWVVVFNIYETDSICTTASYDSPIGKSMSICEIILHKAHSA